MTAQWALIYKALYNTGLKTIEELKAVKPSRLTEEERIEICGE